LLSALLPMSRLSTEVDVPQCGLNSPLYAISWHECSGLNGPGNGVSFKTALMMRVATTCARAPATFTMSTVVLTVAIP
jgi:hypothetical protein